MTDHVQHMKGSGLTAKVKALAWEECRVGGAITGVCVSVGLLMLLWFRFWGGPLMTSRDPYFMLLTILGVPVAVALLLILNLDYSGHLVGGFSKRVLRLPVPTPAAVAVALAARTLFVFITASLMIATSQFVVTDAPGLHVALLITVFYLCAQLVDWLRAPISGFSSLIVLGLIGGGLIFVSMGGVSAREALAAMAAPWASPVVLLVIAAMAYGISVMSVQAARVGWRIGVPEIWEWSNRWTIEGPARLKPFVSPIGAQVWFELRRTVWSLPRTTLLIWLLLLGMSWIITERLGNRGGMTQFRITASFLLFAALLLAAVMQGARTRIVGFRPSMGKPGYDYLQPLTDAQFAWARVFANCAVLLPALVVTVILHFVLGGWQFLTQLIPDALELGATSPREVMWTLASRGLLVGVLAWALLAIGTRVFRRSFGLLWIACVIILSVIDGVVKSRYGWGIVAMGIVLYLIALTIALYAHAWRQGLAPGRTVMVWAGMWASFTWLMHYALASSWPADGVSFLSRLGDLVTAVGVASLVPLVYVSVLMDIRRRRHSAATLQDPAQHLSTRGGRRPFVTVGAGCLVLFVVWLGWPAPPAYEALWKSKGYPVTPAEFDAWYPYVADEENAALNYIRIREMQSVLSNRFYSEQARLGELNRVAQVRAQIVEKMFVVGGAKLSRAEPMSEAAWNATEAYWNGVTAQVAPELKALAANGPHKSRYPIDLKHGHAVAQAHLARLRDLARELRVDALHWTITGEARAATDSILSILPVADSLSNEPLLISQLVRIAIIGIAQQALETILNRADLAEDDLERLYEAFATALPTPDDQMIIDRALVGEASIALETAHLYVMAVASANELKWPLFRLMGLLAYPPEAERMAMVPDLLKVQELGRKPRPVFNEASEQWDVAWRDGQFITPLSVTLVPGLHRVYEAEWRIRTQLDVARTALAVERYRLANGNLPTTLEVLVPTFMDSVPQDYFSETGKLLFYRQHDDGEYVVYSVGEDMEDDRGNETIKRHYQGDITFTVAPPHVRAQPQIAPAQ